MAAYPRKETQSPVLLAAYMARIGGRGAAQPRRGGRAWPQGAIRLPAHMNEKLRKVRKAQGELVAELHRKPTLEETAGQLEWEVGKVRSVLETVPSVSSLDQPLGPEAGAHKLGDFVEDPETHGPDPVMSRRLEEAMRRLPEHERDVLVNLYGLDRDTKATVQELSARLGISERAVRRTQHRAERLLKTLLEPGRRGISIEEVTV